MAISLRTMLIYSAGSIGSGAFFAFNNFILPLALKGVGALSDRVWTRFGRRRPFIAAGILLSALFFLVGSASTTSLIALAVSIFLFSIFFNAAIDPYAALLADITPVRQRSFLSGLSQGIQLLGQVGFLLLLVALTDNKT